MALPDVVFHKDAALGPEALRCFRRGMKPESSGGVAARRPRKGRNSTPRRYVGHPRSQPLPAGRAHPSNTDESESICGTTLLPSTVRCVSTRTTNPGRRIVTGPLHCPCRRPDMNTKVHIVAEGFLANVHSENLHQTGPHGFAQLRSARRNRHTAVTAKRGRSGSVLNRAARTRRMLSHSYSAGTARDLLRCSSISNAPLFQPKPGGVSGRRRCDAPRQRRARHSSQQSTGGFSPPCFAADLPSSRHED